MTTHTTTDMTTHTSVDMTSIPTTSSTTTKKVKVNTTKKVTANATFSSVTTHLWNVTGVIKLNESTMGMTNDMTTDMTTDMTSYGETTADFANNHYIYPHDNPGGNSLKVVVFVSAGGSIMLVISFVLSLTCKCVHKKKTYREYSHPITFIPLDNLSTASNELFNSVETLGSMEHVHNE